MIKAIRTFALLAAAAILCTGCWPMHVISSPGASGIVIDRQTRGPLSGAQVTVSHVWQRDWPNYGVPTVEEALADTRPPLIVTGTNGSFYIPPVRKWIAEYPPPEGHALGSLVVRHDGYKSVVIPLTEGLNDDVGTVLLNRTR